MPRNEPQVSGWGRLSQKGREVFSEDLHLASQTAHLFRGLGRSYGDSSLPAPAHGEVVSTVRANRILDFDAQSGRLRAEAGLSLLELNRLFLSRNLFVPVTPGTQFVTLGGMVAADVHGKNHHVAGCFGSHVLGLKVRLGPGEVVDCSPTEKPDLFWANVGGMGLVGHILEVEFSLGHIPSPWIETESERIDDIDAYIHALKEAAARWPFTVGWIDCLKRGRGMGRGILNKGRWADASLAPSGATVFKKGWTVPFEMPDFVLSPLTVRAFNFAYFWKHLPRKKQGLVAPWPFFYPLDALSGWNLLYGRKGFTQYQCVLPDEAGPDIARRFLERLTRLGGASFLCVIKDCGPEGKGLLSFPLRGISIAVDLPVRAHTQEVVNALNAFVMTHGGRIYLAKDAFTRAEDFRTMEEKRLPAFLDVRRRYGADRHFKSAQSIRLLGDAP